MNKIKPHSLVVKVALNNIPGRQQFTALDPFWGTIIYMLKRDRGAVLGLLVRRYDPPFPL